MEARVRDQELALREINLLPNTHVRHGSITGRGRRKRQKEVDILIAVDMLNHAIRENMEKAVLVAGDRDFVPLIETLVQFGLTVHVAGDHRFTSDVLQEAADHYRRLALHDYLQLVPESVRQQIPHLPVFGDQLDLSFAPEPLASGLIGNKAAGRLLFLPKRNSYALEISHRTSRERYLVITNRAELQRAQLYLELQFGEAAWLETVMESIRP